MLATMTAESNQYTRRNSTFLYNVMTSLSFVRALPASLGALHMSPIVFLKVESIVLNRVRNSCEPLVITFAEITV